MALKIPPSSSISMKAIWLGQSFQIDDTSALEGFMMVLRRARVRDLEAANNVVNTAHGSRLPHC